MYTRYPLMQRCQQMFLAKLHRKIHGLDRTQVAAFKRNVAGSSVASATHLGLLPGVCILCTLKFSACATRVSECCRTFGLARISALKAANAPMRTDAGVATYSVMSRPVSHAAGRWFHPPKNHQNLRLPRRTGI
jgi:hypothetical protein